MRTGRHASHLTPARIHTTHPQTYAERPSRQSETAVLSVQDGRSAIFAQAIRCGSYAHATQEKAPILPEDLRSNKSSKIGQKVAFGGLCAHTQLIYVKKTAYFRRNRHRLLAAPNGSRTFAASKGNTKTEGLQETPRHELIDILDTDNKTTASATSRSAPSSSGHKMQPGDVAQPKRQ